MSTETRFRDFEVEGANIFRVIKKRINPKYVQTKRGKLQREIVDLSQHIVGLQAKLRELESEAAFYNSPEMDAMLKKHEIEQKAADEKAKGLLKGFIGEENFKALIEKGYLRFTAKNGKKYEIKPNGTVYSVSNGRYRLCVIRPKNLPLPDIVLAVLNNVKDNPAKYREIGHRR